MMGRYCELANEEAISTLGQVVTGGSGAAIRVEKWIARVRDRQEGGEPLTVLEHTAMAYVARSGFLDSPSDARPNRTIESVLAKSWLNLTGKLPERRNLTGRLPRSVLRTAGREARLFHLAAFQPRGPKAAASQMSIGRDYTPAILCAVAMGYVVSTLAEYGMHRCLGHEAGRPIKPFLRNLGRIGHKVSSYLDAIYVGHFVIHHVKTSNRYYTTQFASAAPNDRSTIDAELEALGKAGRQIRKSDYGMTLTDTAVMAGLLVTLPIHVTLICVFDFGPVSAVALMAPSLLHVGASRILHPCLHKRRDEIIGTSGPLVSALLKTRYAEWISRSHWIHHKGGGGNFNLVPGADLILGDIRKPNLDLVFRMRADHIVGADWALPQIASRVRPWFETRGPCPRSSP
jgi:hypothetical protein